MSEHDPAVTAGRPRLPAIDWTMAQALRGLLVGLILAFLIAPALVLPFDPDLDGDLTRLIAQALLGSTLLAVALFVAGTWRKRSARAAVRELGLVSFKPSAFGWILVGLFATYVATALFAELVVQPEQEDISGDLGVGDETLLVAVVAVVLMVGLAPVAEELFFRGMLFSGLRDRMSPWPAALLAGLIFGSIHAPSGLTAVVPLAALGVMFCWLYERTGSLWPSVIAHAINNGLALALLA